MGTTVIDSACGRCSATDAVAVGIDAHSIVDRAGRDADALGRVCGERVFCSSFAEAGPKRAKRRCIERAAERLAEPEAGPPDAPELILSLRCRPTPLDS